MLRKLASAAAIGLLTLLAIGLLTSNRLVPQTASASTEESCDALNFEISNQPASPIVLGYTVTLTPINVVGGEAPFTCLWSRKCGACELEAWETRLPDWEALTITWCANEEGTHTFKAVMTDKNGLMGTKTKELVVQGPDGGGPTQASIGAESSAGPIMTLVHKFRFQKGMTLVGPCFQGCVNEKAVFRNADGSWPDEPEDWHYAMEACDSEEHPEFYFHSPDIVDTKTFLQPADWEEKPIGHVFAEYKQWVRLKIPRCGGEPDHRYVGVGPMHFKIKKVSATTVKHELQS